MNTATLTTRFPRIAAVCALALAGIALGSATSVAHAANAGDKARTVIVNYRDLDLSTDQGNLRLYQRIVAAAKQVLEWLQKKQLLSPNDPLLSDSIWSTWTSAKSMPTPTWQRSGGAKGSR